MNPVSIEQFAAATGCGPEIARVWWLPMVDAMRGWGIHAPHQQAMFLAQVSHECGRFTRIQENLNYTAERLMKIWPRRFPSLGAAAPYARSPERLANFVYSNRYGNGPPESGDGWRYRGRGPIQITFKDNYAAFEEASGHFVLAAPDQLLEPTVGADAAGWYWASRDCNQYADSDDIEGCTRAINGGLIGIEERSLLWTHAKSALGV